jgi:chromosome segregation ATPase
VANAEASEGRAMELDDLEKMLQNVESRLVRVGQAIWKPDSKAQVREASEQLSEELRSRHDALEQARAERMAAARRVFESKNAAQVLTDHIQTCLSCGHGDQAWQFALQLDRLRQQLAADQAQLPKLEQVCWSLQFQIRQMERQLARLHEQIYPA